MKKWFKLFVSSLVVFVLAACGKSNDKAGDKETDAEQYGGSLVVYSPNSDGEIENLLYYWGDKHGVDVQLQSLGTGEALAKLEAEKENPQADVMFGGVNLGVYKSNPDLFEKYVAEGNDKIPEEFQNQNGYLTFYLLSGSNLLVNTDLEKEVGMEITSYEDLLDPRLKGKIAMGDATSSSSAFAQLTNMLLVKGDGTYLDDKGWDYVEKFLKNVDGKILGSSSAVYTNTYEGEFVVGVTYEDPSVTLITDGADNLRVVYPEEGAVWLPSASALVKGAKNEENAKRFLDFLVSEEGQTIIAGLSNRPVRTDIENTNENMKPFSDINVAYEDIEFVADHREEIQNRFQKILEKLEVKVQE